MPSSSRDRRLEVEELIKHFKKISTISHKYAINKPTSSYSPQQTKALETILTVKETAERQRRSTIDSWTAAAMNQAAMGELMPTKKMKSHGDDDVEALQQKSHMSKEEDKTTQENSEVVTIEEGDARQSWEDCNSKIEVSTSEQLTPTKKRRNNNARQCSSTPIDDWVDSVMREVANMMPKEVITTNMSRSTSDEKTKAQDITTSCESSILSALTESTISSASSSLSPSATEVPSFSDIQKRHKALKDKMDKIKSNRQESSKRHQKRDRSLVPGQAPSLQSTLEKLGQRKQSTSGVRTSFTSTSTSATEGLSVCSSSCLVNDEINETTVNKLLW